VNPIRVVVVDDQEVVRAGFGALLDTQDDITVVGTAADGAQAVALCAATDPDVVLMDVRMPTMDGITATARIVAASDRVVCPTPRSPPTWSSARRPSRPT